jgi:transketolase
MKTMLSQEATGYADLPRLMSLMNGDEKHEASAHSTLDVIWVLYDKVLRVDPTTIDHPSRDRFLLSKGHGPMAYYAALAAKGFIGQSHLATFARHHSILGNHPDRLLVPGVEISSGSLGHGMPIAVGAALALRARRLDSPRVFCLIGDGELDEGSNAEAIALAGRFELGSLTVIVVDNASSTHGWPGGISSRFTVEGWESVVIDGRNHAQIEQAAIRSHPGAPLAIVATIGGPS